MRLLHISDLHLMTPIGRGIEIILSRFYDFIEKNSEDIPIDHLVITGDIRDFTNNGKSDEIVHIIKSIANSAKIYQVERIHIIPGNHDLCRGCDDGKTIGRIRNNYDTKRGVFQNPLNDLSFMLNRFNDFFWPLCDILYGREKNPWINRYENPHSIYIDHGNAFIYLNSCLTCIDRSSDGDLIIGLNYLHQHLKKLPNVHNVFLLSHHPLQNLTSAEENELEALITSMDKKGVFWLCGDAHNNRAQSRDYIKLFQVGSLTGGSDTIPDFAIYDIHNDHFVQRRVFRFLTHLNSTSPNQGGWKRVYIDQKSPSLHTIDLDDATLI